MVHFFIYNNIKYFSNHNYANINLGRVSVFPSSVFQFSSSLIYISKQSAMTHVTFV